AFIYLRVSTAEVTDAQDADLGNDGDIGFETALRERVEWEVLVSVAAINQPDHFLLADFVNMPGNQSAANDRRVTGLTLARIREELNSSSTTAAAAHARLDLLMGNTNTIKDNIVTQTKIADNAVTNSKLADNAVGSAEIQDGAVTNNKLGPKSVTANKIGDVAVGSDQLANGSVTLQKLSYFVITNTSTVLTPGQVRDILIQENLAADKQIFYFPMITLASTSGSSGSSVVTANIIYKQNAGTSTHNVFLRLTNSPTNANTVDVIYRVDIFNPF
ncbi:MAG TPA: hypothetical protein VF754_02445, partial [Pyrinomonadaceae bacterium]